MGRAVFDLFGGMAGRMLSFCWNSTFRGFRAGGGQPYRMDGDTPVVVEQSTWLNIGDKDDVFNENYAGSNHRNMTPIPGQFPEDGFIDDYMSHPQAHQEDQPLTPIPKNERGGGTLRSNWVFVQDAGGMEEKEHGPVRAAAEIYAPTTRCQARWGHGALISGRGNRRRLAPSRPSFTSTPESHNKRPASFASPRASPGRSRPSRTTVRATEVGSRASSSAPPSPDVQRFEKKIRRKERREDESMQRLNRQLQDMIKEGKEALGTRIEVEEDRDEDEGYGGGAELMDTSKW